jgi:hypothetical protein
VRESRKCAGCEPQCAAWHKTVCEGTVQECARCGTARVRTSACGAPLTATSQRFARRDGKACVCACVRRGLCRRRAHAKRVALGCQRHGSACAACLAVLRERPRSCDACEGHGMGRGVRCRGYGVGSGRAARGLGRRACGDLRRSRRRSWCSRGSSGSRHSGRTAGTERRRR